jgi:hypothetical protein
MKQSYASAGKAPRRRVHSPSGIAAIAVYGLPPPRIVIGYRASSAVRKNKKYWQIFPAYPWHSKPDALRSAICLCHALERPAGGPN